jgi:hypothetical protein
MDTARYIARHVVNLPKSVTRDLNMANSPQLNDKRLFLNLSNSTGLNDSSQRQC